MFDKLKSVYEACLYKVSVLGTKILTKTMKHWVEFNGLDPNSDPQKSRDEKFRNDLVEALGGKGEPAQRRVLKIPIRTKPNKYDVPHNSYTIKDNPPPGTVPDFSNCDDSLVAAKVDAANKLLPQVPEYKTYYTVEDQKIFDLMEGKPLENEISNSVKEKPEKKPSRKPAKKKAKKPVKKPVKKNKKK